MDENERKKQLADKLRELETTWASKLKFDTKKPVKKKWIECECGITYSEEDKLRHLKGTTHNRIILRKLLEKSSKENESMGGNASLSEELPNTI